MAAIIPFPALTAPTRKPDPRLALAKQWAQQQANDDALSAQIKARFTDLLDEADPDPVAARLAAIEAKLDTLLSKRRPAR